MTYTEACLAINMIPKVGPVRLRRLLQVFDEPQAILRAPADRLAGVEGIGPEIARRIVGWESLVDLPAELTRMADAGIHVLTAQSDVYPPLLRSIHDPPIVLYVWGELTAADAQAVGVVGSRQSTVYGVEVARKFSYQLASAGYTIFSGLARGIDTAAHQGALAAQRRTVAVLGCGLSHIYPPENFALAERIADGFGAVISEFPMFVPPDRTTFPMRNRIISGCSQGVVVVEAGLQSGALISANQAAEQSRTVFAVPGPIDRPSSQGTNQLIQQGAKLVVSVEDIVEELTMLPGIVAPPTRRRPQDAPRAESSRPAVTAPSELPVATPVVPLVLNPNEQAVYDAISPEETPVDLIIVKCGLPTPVVSSSLFTLELKKLIKQLPGKHYVRLS